MAMLRSTLGELLDTIEVAYSEFDEHLCALAWNATFLAFFPEHAGKVHVGEPYAENLRRFYQCRLPDDEIPHIGRYIAEGLTRHRQQMMPFEFTHRGRKLRASSLPLPGGGRVRVWKQIGALSAEVRSNAMPPFDALDNIADGACVAREDGGILAANARFRKLYDVPRDRGIVGLPLEKIIAEAWAMGAAQATSLATIRNRLRYDGAPFEVELPGDRWRRVITQHADDGHAYTIHADITVAKREHRDLLAAQETLKVAIRELDNLARRDPLTGLPNRRIFDAELAASGESACVLMIDVDRFKDVNDRFGHGVGDACLRRVASIIERSVASISAMPARIGGEEFAVLVRDGDRTEAVRLAERICTDVADANFEDLIQATNLTVSIGIGVQHSTASMRHETADRALYRAKAAGRNTVCVEEESVHSIIDLERRG